MNQYDPRINNELLISNPFNAETANKYLGRRGYFTDDIFNFSNLDNCCTGMLASVEADNRHPYYCGIADGGVIISGNFSFFLSAEFVEEKPKEKFIPFRYLCELTDAGIEVGKVISIRNKNDDTVVAKVLVTEINYNHEDNEVINIALGATGYEFSTLFNSYLFQVNGEWKPFGVKEE